MQSKATTVSEYLASLPADRRQVVETVRKVIRANLDMGKACVRFKTAEDLALEVIGEAFKRLPAKMYIEQYQQVRTANAKVSAAKSVKTRKAV